MKSTKVNAGDTATAEQYNNLVDDAFGGSQLLAHQQTTPNMTLKVEKGIAYLDGMQITFAGGNSPTFTAPTTNPRIDLLVMNSDGTLSIIQGTEAASPSPPTYPTDKLVICEVFLRVGSTAIYDTDQGANAYIRKDAREFLFKTAKQILNATQSDPTRSFGTTYQNTTGKLLLVVVTVKTKGPNTLDGYGRAIAQIGSSSPPTSEVGRVGVEGAVETVGTFPIFIDTLSFIVPKNFYYRVITEQSHSFFTPILSSWVEYKYELS
jgi:hypothetical protein